MSEFSKDSVFKQEADRQAHYAQLRFEDDGGPMTPMVADLKAMDQRATQAKELSKQASFQMDMDSMIEEALDLLRAGFTSRAVTLLEDVQQHLRNG